MVVVDAETTVEDACDVYLFLFLNPGYHNSTNTQKLLSEEIECLVVVDNTARSTTADDNQHWTGLFDLRFRISLIWPNADAYHFSSLMSMRS